jgi:hypothetical protein
MSKGPAISLGGVFLFWSAGLGYLWTALPWVRPFILAAYGLGIVALLLLVQGMKRRLAQSDCHVAIERPASAREQLGLWFGIPMGVAAVLGVGLIIPRTLDLGWIGPAGSALFLLVLGGYLLYAAVQVRLFELGVLGAALAGLCLPAFYVYRFPVTEETLQNLLIAIFGGTGILQLVLGVSLQRRWAAWRTQALLGGTEPRP